MTDAGSRGRAEIPAVAVGAGERSTSDARVASETPVTVSLPAALAQVRDRWLELPRPDQDRLYASDFAAAFAPLFAALPLHGAPPELGRPRALISVLGLSWQPVALMAAWVKPERLLAIGTAESLAMRAGEEGVVSLIARIARLDRDRVHTVEVGGIGEAEVYRAVRDFLRRYDLRAREVFIDPTGGKKSMSAAAALAGFLAGAPLVYVDYVKYRDQDRIPVPGTEFPRVLDNPLDVLGDLELRDVFAAFNRGDFGEAQRLAEKLASRLYEPWEAKTLALLAAGYGAWDAFRFADASKALSDAREKIDRFAARGGWRWAPAVRVLLDANLSALEALSSAPPGARPDSLQAGTPLLVAYLAAARRLLAAGKASLAVLLTYSAVERFVNLCLRVDFGLDDENPNYSSIAERLDRAAYDEAGRRLYGAKYRSRPLEGPIMFSNGAQLLAALSPDRLPHPCLGPLQGLASARNRSEYQHGLLPDPPDPAKIQRFIELAEEIVAGICGGAAALKERLAMCRFPQLAGA